MSDLIDVYQHQVIRSVTGAHPVMLEKIADPVALDCLCHRLADADEARQLLCAAGHGWPSQSLADFVRTVLKIARTPPATSTPYPDPGEIHDIWTSR
jgi:hypothetical protein